MELAMEFTNYTLPATVILVSGIVIILVLLSVHGKGIVKEYSLDRLKIFIPSYLLVFVFVIYLFIKEEWLIDIINILIGAVVGVIGGSTVKAGKDQQKEIPQSNVTP